MYLLSDVATQKFLPLEFSAEIGHDGINVIDIVSLIDKQRERSLIDPDSLETVDCLFRKRLLLFLILEMHLDILHSEIHQQISNGLHLASYFEVDQNQKVTLVCLHITIKYKFSD